MTTVFAPSGIGAPVMILLHVPEVIVFVGLSPAAMVSSIFIGE